MNNFTFEIFDFSTKTYTDYTAFAVFPFSFANLLDEQLDEAQITLKGLPKTYTHPITGVTINNGEVLKPFIICRVGLANAPKCVLTEAQSNQIAENKNNSNWTYNYDTDNKRRYEFNNCLFFVANDRAIEKPVGSGKYNHELYLIELTKITERYIGDNLTFTNSLGSNYLSGAVFAQPADATVGQGYNSINEFGDKTLFDYYTTPVQEDNNLTILSLNQITGKLRAYLSNVMEEDGIYVDTIVLKGDNYPASITVTIGGNTTVYNPATVDTTYTIKAEQTITIEYDLMVVSCINSSRVIYRCISP